MSDSSHSKLRERREQGPRGRSIMAMPQSQSVDCDTQDQPGQQSLPPFDEVSQAFPKVPFPNVQTSLDYLNGQNKTATYIQLFIPSSVTETHILTPSYRCPKYMKLFPLPSSKEIKMRTFHLGRIKQRILPLNSECLSFGMRWQDSTLHVFGGLVSIQDVILLIQYSTNDKWKNGKNWPFINEFSDSSKPEELLTTAIYIHIRTHWGPHEHAEHKASHLTLPT